MNRRSDADYEQDMRKLFELGVHITRRHRHLQDISQNLLRGTVLSSAQPEYDATTPSAPPASASSSSRVIEKVPVEVLRWNRSGRNLMHFVKSVVENDRMEKQSYEHQRIKFLKRTKAPRSVDSNAIVMSIAPLPSIGPTNNKNNSSSSQLKRHTMDGGYDAGNAELNYHLQSGETDLVPGAWSLNGTSQSAAASSSSSSSSSLPTMDRVSSDNSLTVRLASQIANKIEAIMHSDRKLNVFTIGMNVIDGGFDQDDAPPAADASSSSSSSTTRSRLPCKLQIMPDFDPVGFESPSSDAERRNMSRRIVSKTLTQYRAQLHTNQLQDVITSKSRHVDNSIVLGVAVYDPRHHKRMRYYLVYYLKHEGAVGYGNYRIVTRYLGEGTTSLVSRNGRICDLTVALSTPFVIEPLTMEGITLPREVSTAQHAISLTIGKDQSAATAPPSLSATSVQQKQLIRAPAALTSPQQQQRVHGKNNQTKNTKPSLKVRSVGIKNRGSKRASNGDAGNLPTASKHKRSRKK